MVSPRLDQIRALSPSSQINAIENFAFNILESDTLIEVTEVDISISQWQQTLPAQDETQELEPIAKLFKGTTDTFSSILRLMALWAQSVSKVSINSILPRNLHWRRL